MSNLLKLSFVLLFVAIGCSQARYHNLHWLEKRLERAQRQTPRCGLDLVFVLDDSSSIWGPDFDKQIEFVSEVIDNVNVGTGPTDTRVGIMAFSDRVEPDVIPLGDQQVQTVQHDVSEIKQRAGQETKTDEALKALREKAFNDARPGVPHVALVITDGKSTKPDRTATQARLTKQEITMFAVGVGDSYDPDELNTIASSPNYVLEVQGGYSALSSHLQELSDLLCAVTTIPPCSRPTDVLFSAPDQAGIDDTAHALAFIKQVVGELHLGPDATHVGLTPRLSEMMEGIALNEFVFVSPLANAIDSRELESTDLAEQLKYLERTGFERSHGGRPGAKQIAVLIVDNYAFEDSETSLLAQQLKNDGKVLFVVGVGDHIDTTQLQTICSSDKPYNTYYEVDGYDELSGIQLDLKESICSASDE